MDCRECQQCVQLVSVLFNSSTCSSTELPGYDQSAVSGNPVNYAPPEYSIQAGYVNPTPEPMSLILLATLSCLAFLFLRPRTHSL